MAMQIHRKRVSNFIGNEHLLANGITNPNYLFSRIDLCEVKM